MWKNYLGIILRIVRRVTVLVLFIIAACVGSGNEQTLAAQNQVLKGPILVGETLDPVRFQNAGIVFEEVGTGHVWELGTPSSKVRLAGWTQEDSWSPDGCKLLIVKSLNNGYSIAALSISDLAMDDLPQLGTPIWSLDGNSIYFFQDSSASDYMNVYITDANGQNPKLLRSIDNWIGYPHWLSKEELLYSDGYNWLVWNIATNDIHPFYSESEQIPPSLVHRAFYSTATNISPDHLMQAGYFTMQFNGEPDEATPPDPTLAPQMAGFDLYFLKQGGSRHVDVAGQFVGSLVWSPSSRLIATTTDYPGSDYGIFVYDVENDTLQRVGDAFSGQFPGTWTLSWSPDEEWLDFITPSGYVIQRLSDGERIPLDKRMNGSYQLYWSPIMDYSHSQCG